MSENRRDRFVRRILRGEDRSVGAALLRGALYLLSLLHLLGLKLILWTEQVGLRKRFRAGVPVLVIGNLSSGGTGKTPMTVRVVRHLQSRGKRVVVLSRGHGGSSVERRIPGVVSDGSTILLSPAEAGEEPVLIAEMLPGVPVVVCRDRRKSAALAEAQFSPEVLVLDDGLQHWKLHRDLDIVLLDARNPFDNGFILPRGLLREPPAHLSRAGIVVLTRADRLTPAEVQALRNRVQALAPRAAVFTAVHAPQAWLCAGDSHEQPLNLLAGKRAVGFAGIADGVAFFQTVEQLGVVLVAREAFRDHHPYSPEDMQRLQALARQHDAVLVTTEKDLVKVQQLQSNDAPPLFALRIGMQVTDDVAFDTQIGLRLFGSS
ncbi:MAG: tetraacyldisaccharide 4'-kinase [Armatimonadaceae bacterium]